MSAPERPAGAALLALVAQAYLYRFPRGTRGETWDWERSTHPEPGDFVIVQGAFAPTAWTLGWLVEVELAAVESDTAYTVECVDGETRRWSNVRVRSIPVGDIFALDRDPEGVRRRWQPEAPRERAYVAGGGIVSITIQKGGA